MSPYGRPILIAASALAVGYNVAEGAVVRTRKAAASPSTRQLRFLEQRRRPDTDGGYDGRGVQAKVFGGVSNFEGDSNGLFGDMFEDSASQFRFLDNLEPVAPMDSISEGQEVENKRLRDFSTAGRPTPAGESRGRLDALYVPPYSRPDAFPRIEGDSCICGPASVLNPAGPQCVDGLGLSAIDSKECPDMPFQLPNCTAAKAGELCEANANECGADTQLNNCKLWDVYRKAGVPSVALPGVPTTAQMPAWAQAMGLQPTKPSSLVLPVVCRCGKELEEIEEQLPPAVKAAVMSTTTTTTPKPDWPQCADGLRLFPVDAVDCPDKPYKLPSCDSAGAGEMCEMDGNECGASSSLNNCKVWDVYRKAGAAGANAGILPASPSGAPATVAAAATTQAPRPTTTTTKPLHVEGTHAPENRPQMEQSFHYYRRIPVFNSSTQYAMQPADVTYSNGNYWMPRVVGGLVAPFDRLPLNMYPLQAPADEAKMVPVAARGDRLAYRFARYMDQVEDRSKECDNVSPDCTEDCIPGDQVTMTMGSLSSQAKVVTTHVGNMVTVEFVPTAANARPDRTGPSCLAGAGCSLFKVCYMAGMPCAPEEDKQYFDYLHNLQHNRTCPDGFKICGKIQQMVEASYLKKNGRACRAAVATTTLPPP